MSLGGVPSVSVAGARMFQPSTANTSRPHPNPNSEAILKLFDNKPKSFTKLRGNHLAYGMSPQMKFVIA